MDDTLVGDADACIGVDTLIVWASMLTSEPLMDASSAWMPYHRVDGHMRR